MGEKYTYKVTRYIKTRYKTTQTAVKGRRRVNFTYGVKSLLDLGIIEFNESWSAVWEDYLSSTMFWVFVCVSWVFV